MGTSSKARSRRRNKTIGLCALGALAGPPGAVHAQGLLGDINGTPTGRVTPVANTWQQYTYAFTAELPTTFLTFLFKNNPNVTGLDDISLSLTSGGANLLLNGDLETKGTVVNANVTLPDSWLSVGTPGLSFPGSWRESTPGLPGAGRTHTGTGVWSDGAINGFDGITQSASTVTGQDYTLTFWLGSGTVPDGQNIDSKVIAGLNIDTLQPSYAASQIGVSVNPIFNGGKLLLDQNGATYSQNFTLDNSATNAIDQAGNNATFTGVFGNAVLATPGGITIGNSGAGGSVTFTGINTYTGSTTIGSGATLALSGSGSIATTSSLIDNGTFAISATKNGASIPSLTGSGLVLLGDRTLSITAGNSTFSGTISGGGELTVAGGSAGLNGINTYTGSTTIDSGATLALSGSGSIATTSSLIDNGTFDISATKNGASIPSLTGAGSVALGAGTLTLTKAAGTFGGTIGGTGGLLIAAGTETLTGNNSYTGTTSIATGATLALSGSGGIAKSSSVTATGSFDISPAAAGVSIISLGGSGTVLLGANTLTLTKAADSFAGSISGSGGLTIAAGVEGLSGANFYSGATTINAGATLALSGTGSIAKTSGLVADGLFDISATNAGASIAGLTGSGSVALGSRTLTLGAGSGTFAGTIGGAGGVAVLGGSHAFTGQNTYQGGTAVSGGGTLAIDSDAALGSASSGLHLTAGTLSALTSFSSSRAVLLDGSGGTINLNGQSVDLLGVVSGPAGLFAIGGGRLGLGATNTYGGATTISAGTTLALTGSGSIAASLGVDNVGAFDVSGVGSGATSVSRLAGNGIVVLGNTTLTLTAAQDLFTGAITGAGGFALAAGQQTVGGINGYTGGTTIGAGSTLALAGAGSIAASSGVTANGTFDIAGLGAASATVTTLGGSGAVVLGDKTLLLTNASTTFAGTIGGAGGLAVSGGTQTLTGSNSYAGGTSITAAALAINSDAALGASGGGLSLTNGTLAALADVASARPVALQGTGTVNTGAVKVTLTGVVSGSGALTVSGGGRLDLTGTTNSYAGGTTISGGSTLGIAMDAALGTADSALTFDNGTLLALGGFSTPRPIIVTSGGGSVDANGYLVLLTGPITLNGPLNSIGTGRVSFSNNAQVNGDLNVTQGTFTNTGTINAISLSVAPTAALRGTGTINAPTTVNGTLAPGNSPGTLTFLAPLTLAATSTTQFDIDGTGTGSGAGNYSRILVTGAGNTATVNGTLRPLLRGITGDATNTYTPPIGQTFQVISAEGGVLGSYTGLSQPSGLPAGTRFDALYGATTLTLAVTPQAYGDLPLAGLSQTANQAAVGQALDAIRPAAGIRMGSATAALFEPLYQLSGPAIAPALDQLAPGIYGDGLFSTRSAWYGMAASVSDQLAARRGVPVGGATAPGPAGSTVWVSGLGQFTRVNSTAAPGFHSSFGGAIAGIDVPVGDGFTVGAAAGGGSLRTTSSNDDRDSASLVQFLLYGGFQSGLFFADAQAGYIHVDRSVRRNLSAWSAATRGDGAINGGGGLIDGGVRLNYGPIQVEPTVGLALLGLSGSAADESSGGGLAQRVAGQSITSLQSFAGVRVGTTVNVTPSTPLNLRALVGWQHEFLDTTARTTASFGGLSLGSFATTTAPISRDAARLGVGFDVALSSQVSVFGNYVAAVGGPSTAQNLTGGVRFVW